MGEQSELKRYFDELNVRLSAIEHVKKQINYALAPDFSLFSILWPDEIRLSNMIAQILNPHGKHGQSSIYLDLFLGQIGTFIDQTNGNRSIVDAMRSLWATSTLIKTHLEYSTNLITANQRRMDILIEGNGYGLMIENKPWATDQAEQLSDYSEDLSRRYKNNYVMVYLSGNGQTPSTDSLPTEKANHYEKNGHLICVDYFYFMAEWLQKCIEITEPDRVRWILKDFKKYIEANFETQYI